MALICADGIVFCDSLLHSLWSAWLGFWSALHSSLLIASLDGYLIVGIGCCVLTTLGLQWSHAVVWSTRNSSRHLVISICGSELAACGWCLFRRYSFVGTYSTGLFSVRNNAAVSVTRLSVLQFVWGR